MLTNVSCSQDGQGIVDETLAQYRCLSWYDIFSFWLHSIKTWKVNLNKKRNKELDLSWVLSNAVMNGRCKPNEIWPNLLTYKVKEDDNCHAQIPPRRTWEHFNSLLHIWKKHVKAKIRRYYIKTNSSIKTC